jgi:predicted phage terminase large subunit-like protein
MDTYQIVETFFDVYALHYGVTFLVEKGAIWEAIKAVLFKTMALKNKFFPIVEVSPLNDKKGKASPLQHRLRAKAVRFDKDSLWWPECEAELKQFPLGRHDDQIDAIGMVPRKLDKLAEGMDYQEPDQYDIEEEEAEDYLDFEVQLGRSSVTGY